MIGEYVSGYYITAHLGKGGMGTVYRATDNALGRDVALKMLHPHLIKETQFLERFKKEARVLAKLLHPNIAVIYNFIEQNGNYFMIMEYVQGSNMDELLKKYGPLSPDIIAASTIQALEGLHHAHKKEILHRDIKPANMMLTEEGVLKLMDFGIAKIANEQKMTQANRIVGTIEYMAPELIEGKEASVSSDIYAMGIALYELATGKLPFESDTDYNLMQAIVKHKVVLPENLNASIPKALSQIILKSVEKNPANRYPDARSLQLALIQAFPGYKETDLVKFINQAPSSTGRDALTQLSTALPETKMASAAATVVSSSSSWKDRFSRNKIPFIIGGVMLLVFAGLVLALGSKKNANLQANVNAAPADTIKKIQARAPVTVTSVPVTVLPETVTEEKPKETGNKLPVQTTPIIIDMEVPVQKKTTEKKQEKKTEKKNTPVVKNETKVKPAPVEYKEPEKTVTKKDIIIDYPIEVPLFLQDIINTTERKEERSVSFSVTRPVIYQGTTIIKQGATAKGIIKTGRVLAEVTIYSVTGADGQQLEFKPDRIRRKKNDLASERNFTATLKKGIRMRL